MPDERPPLPVCGECQQVHERGGRATCRAHTRRDGVRGPCRNYPVEGAVVCRFHGGNAPQVRAAAARRTGEAAMDRVLRYAIGEPDPAYAHMSPDEQLLQEVARSATAVQWLAERVAELHVPDPEDTGILQDVTGFDDDGNPVFRANQFNLYGPDHNQDLAVHPLWKKLDEERDRHARFCKLAIDAGISERLVRIAEAQGTQIVSVIVHVVEALGLPPDVRDRARRLAADKLRTLGPGGPGVVDVTPRQK